MADTPTAWHALSTSQALERLDSRSDGLLTEEAGRRLEEYGPNRLAPPKRRGPLGRFLLQFHNVLIYVLIAAGLITAFLQHWVDAAVIFGVVVINAIVGFVQEGKAERALEAIRRMLSQQATVLRDGTRIAIQAEDLVPGDIVFIQSGDRVPADLRLLWTKSLQIQEAVLTGESIAAQKDAAPIAETAPLGDRASMTYSGTLVTYGQGTGLVVATGGATEVGRISAMLVEVQTLTTPLLRKLSQFARWLTFAILGLAAATVLFGVFVHGNPPSEMFLAGVGLAVAAIPEGLPAIMTITLAIGVQRMARENAIIRRLPAVETLGSVTTICSDKTGTLTRNEMTVQTIATADHVFEVTGSGYGPEGDFVLDGADVQLSEHPILAEIARAGLHCSDARLRNVEGEWVVDGDPMEGALLAVAMKARLELEAEGAAMPRTDIIPFESDHRYMATLHHDGAGTGTIYVKGAPERLLEMCGAQRSHPGSDVLDRPYWEERVARIVARGQRVLAVAAKQTDGGRGGLSHHDVAGGLTLIGLFGLADPPRAGAIEAIARCAAAGIGVKMITGDHAGTAIAIGDQLGLAHAEAALTGPEIDAMDDATLADMIGRVDVFARTSPAHKLRLVEALQSRGDIVAMTGDGVNDAPALKRADVGIAMGVKGTEAAKEAAEMVLADDDFASIANAVAEGRTVYDNLRKAITFILPTNGGEALTVVLAVLLGGLLPVTPVQILWVNMITAVTLALALAFERAESDVMARPPRPPDEPLLSRFLVWRVVFVSIILVAGTFGLFAWWRDQGASIEEARTIAVNTLVAFEIFYLFNTRFLRTSALSVSGIFGSVPILIAVATVILLQAAFTYAGPFQAVFETRSISWQAWIGIVLVGSTVFFLVEAEKWISSRGKAVSDTRPRGASRDP